MVASVWSAIAKHIAQVTEHPFIIRDIKPVSGGCINQGHCLIGEQQQYFVKLNQAERLSMFEVEALGLAALTATQTIKVPQVICCGYDSGQSYLVLEWLEFSRGSADSWRVMGQQLAQLHCHSGSQRFGWQQDNIIGSTPQPNPWMDNWATFFAEHRIGYQLRLAQRRGGNFPYPNQVVPKIKAILGDRRPPPALVHGDLWSGNVAILMTGEPVILDPAVYYGDPEVDVAMTELFGGFPASFYQGYNTYLPIDSGYQQRKTLYNLYHILNHFNLFGGGYERQAQQMLQQCLG